MFGGHRKDAELRGLQSSVQQSRDTCQRQAQDLQARTSELDRYRQELTQAKDQASSQAAYVKQLEAEKQDLLGRVTSLQVGCLVILCFVCNVPL